MITVLADVQREQPGGSPQWLTLVAGAAALVALATAVVLILRNRRR